MSSNIRTYKIAYNKMINRNARQNEQDYTDTRRQAHKIWKLLIITMKLRIFYQEVKSIRKGFQPQTLLITDKEGNIVSSKEEVLQRWFEYYEKRFILQDGTGSGGGGGWTKCLQTAEPHIQSPNVVDTEMATEFVQNSV
jgi:hypothetical protein